MIATNSHGLPMDKTDIREKREKGKKRGGAFEEKRAEMRIQPLFSLKFSYILALLPVSSPLHCIYIALSV